MQIRQTISFSDIFSHPPKKNLLNLKTSPHRHSIQCHDQIQHQLTRWFGFGRNGRPRCLWFCPSAQLLFSASEGVALTRDDDADGGVAVKLRSHFGAAKTSRRGKSLITKRVCHSVSTETKFLVWSWETKKKGRFQISKDVYLFTCPPIPFTYDAFSPQPNISALRFISLQNFVIFFLRVIPMSFVT